jgi:hypothetical protein
MVWGMREQHRVLDRGEAGNKKDRFKARAASDDAMGSKVWRSGKQKPEERPPLAAGETLG